MSTGSSKLGSMSIITASKASSHLSRPAPVDRRFRDTRPRRNRLDGESADIAVLHQQLPRRGEDSFFRASEAPVRIAIRVAYRKHQIARYVALRLDQPTGASASTAQSRPTAVLKACSGGLP